jgi:hypothetical protein
MGVLSFQRDIHEATKRVECITIQSYAGYSAIWLRPNSLIHDVEVEWLTDVVIANLARLVPDWVVSAVSHIRPGMRARLDANFTDTVRI